MKLFKIINKLVENEVELYGVDVLTDLITKYIKKNDPELITDIETIVAYNTAYTNIVKENYKNSVTLYRGICGKGVTPTVDEVLFTEKQCSNKSVSKSYEVAEKYASQGSPKWSYVIQYNVDSKAVLVDIDLFNITFNKKIKNEEEVIIRIHECNSMEIKSTK